MGGEGNIGVRASGRGFLGVFNLLENIHVIHYYYCRSEGVEDSIQGGEDPPPLENTLYVHSYDQIPLCTHNSSLEGATELKFAPLRSLSDAFFAAIRFWPNRTDYVVQICFRCTLSIAGAVAGSLY